MRYLILLIILSEIALSDFNATVLDQDSNAVISASIQILNTKQGTYTDHLGNFSISSEKDSIRVVVSSIAHEKMEVTLYKNKSNLIIIKEKALFGNEVVVTGTRTDVRRTDSPVIVGVISQSTLEKVQACSVSDALSFQPGLRLETDCQTCNYTQLRMNGLGGAYSQILINGRPVFSPLTGLYGLEQIPSNMVEQIEVVRGGGSSLYGSSAIGGTVNIITRLPKQSNYQIDISQNRIAAGVNDNLINGNLTFLSDKGNAGISLFVNHRSRDAYDHNGDNFSELPEINNTSFGAKAEYIPSVGHRLELNFSTLNEYRYGGEMVDGPSHLALQSEERTHNILMTGLNYDIDLSEINSDLMFYAAGQSTKRKHYTGIFPDDPSEIAYHLEAPPYGNSLNTTYQVGTQFNKRFDSDLFTKNDVTVGLELLHDDVYDKIESYNYLIDQVSQDIGLFAQSNIELNNSFDLLTGIRLDKHNLLDNLIFSPRISALYKLGSTTQFRATWGQGFRAPQAFDADMHIAFAGGGVSRINIANDLKEERSDSYSLSINYDKADEHKIFGFTLEAFHTRLRDAFYLHPIGEDEFGERFEKRNGPGASVSGITLELRANFDNVFQIESGFTLQESLFNETVENIEGLEARKEFLRTPNDYGYLNLNYKATEKIDLSMNSVYTGSMLLVHFAGAPEQKTDEYVNTPQFLEIGLRAAYTLEIPGLETGIELIGGVRNLTNSYQNDFDTLKNRDSNYIYGPSRPRTIYFGIGVGS